MAEQQKEEFKYDVIRSLGVISVNKTGWTREANVIAWNGRPAKLDIRDWSPDHTRMSRGITLNGEESDKLKEILEAAVVE
ncbi:MAG: hypothetical protein II133_04900 [Lachnospiraceae bacterium]|nr:hypothetical protein [Lachnospiraceae bacterium]